MYGSSPYIEKFKYLSPGQSEFTTRVFD